MFFHCARSWLTSGSRSAHHNCRIGFIHQEGVGPLHGINREPDEVRDARRYDKPTLGRVARGQHRHAATALT